MTPNAMPANIRRAPKARRARVPRTIRNTAMADQLKQKGFAK